MIQQTESNSGISYQTSLTFKTDMNNFNMNNVLHLKNSRQLAPKYYKQTYYIYANTTSTHKHQIFSKMQINRSFIDQMMYKSRSRNLLVVYIG